MDLIADHISHRFGALEVLDDVSFTVGAGEVVAIVGPSGCGKSTLLQVLGGLLQPSAGAAELRGAPPKGSLNPLTFVFQDFALLPWCTVEENVEFPLLHTGLTLGERRAVGHGGRVEHHQIGVEPLGDPAPMAQAVVAGGAGGHHLDGLLHREQAPVADHLAQHHRRIVAVAHQVEVGAGVRATQHHPPIPPYRDAGRPSLVAAAE